MNDTATATPTTGFDAAHIRLLEDKARFVREETLRLIAIAKVGHFASTFSCAEILAVLYYDILRLKRGEPRWPDRDRLLWGKGHAAVGQYPLLVDWGFFDKAILDDYTRVGNPLGDHPDMRLVPGVDFSSGSLGHALSAGVGMAHGARLQGKDFHVFALLGDGEMQEGQVWEAAMHASTHRLSRLVAIVDRNGYQLDGKVDDIIHIEPLDERFRAFGWEVHTVDGHSIRELLRTLRAVKADTGRTKPVCVIASTVKGKGVSYMETEPGSHLGYLAPDDNERALQEIR
jgi:transketolase